MREISVVVVVKVHHAVLGSCVVGFVPCKVNIFEAELDRSGFGENLALRRSFIYTDKNKQSFKKPSIKNKLPRRGKNEKIT